MRRPRLLISCFALLYLLLSTAPAPAAAPELNRLLAELQKASPGSPQERDLQKSAIALIQKMKSSPPVPQDVHRHMARGEAFVEEAKDKSGFDLAIREFQDAARKAPWLATAYYNLGVVQEKAGQHDAAMESFRMYLLADPKAKDASEVQKRIYKLEARKELAGKQQAERRQQEQARLDAERQRREEAARKELAKQDLAGEWIEGATTIRNEWTYIYRFERRGGEYVVTPSFDWGKRRPSAGLNFRLRVDGFKITGTVEQDLREGWRNGFFYRTSVAGNIRKDGKMLTLRFRSVYPAGAVGNVAKGWGYNDNWSMKLYRK